MSAELQLMQRLFDQSVKGVILQGRPSLGRVVGPAYSNSSCMYRGDNGLRCAVGHCIKDEFYTPATEGAPVGVPVDGGRAWPDDDAAAAAVYIALARSVAPAELTQRTIDMLRSLQMAHDAYSEAAPLAQWRTDFAKKAHEVATVYGLSHAAVILAQDAFGESEAARGTV